LSEPGQGTTATLTLPISDSTESAEVEVSSFKETAGRPSDHTAHTTQQSAPLETHRIRVLLVDDHAMIRAGLKAMLLDYPTVDIVGEGSNGADAVELARSLRPEVLVMDVTMPVMDGIEATRIITQEFPSVIVIGLTVHSAVQVMTAMKEAGATAVLTKETAADQLHRIIYESWEAQSQRGRQRTGEAGAIAR
jgi:CheY-like chemotaxis protein